MKRGRGILSCLLLASLLLLAGCSGAPEKQTETTGETDSWRVVVASDLHYLASSLTDHGALFRRVMEAGDGKVTELCDEITDAFLEEVKAEEPDALILTGDISFNGEKESHLALAEKLAALEEAGVPVLVLPGNHDLYRSCYSFFGDEGEQVESVSAEEFAAIYGAFGFDEALSRDDDSLSYLARINDMTRVLMLDADTPHDFCSLSDKTLLWIERRLSEAAVEGKRMLVACHQNLYKHSMFGAGYVLGCSDELHALLEKYGAELMLSGHMHIQHIQTEGGVTEIATSPLTMGACQYGLLSSENGALRYETRPVNVAAWASARGMDDERLATFAAYAMGRLESRTRTQAEEQLEARGISTQEAAPLVNYACALNNAYFCGDLSGIPALDPDGELFKAWAESGSFFGSYFASIEHEIGENYTRWEKPEVNG
ncbi:MAG: metallophosphoesterase [Oscillospiraceae bacterium]|nr:metallophosphoesterase [Oscillospiraceae bacterium]